MGQREGGYTQGKLSPRLMRGASFVDPGLRDMLHHVKMRRISEMGYGVRVRLCMPLGDWQLGFNQSFSKTTTSRLSSTACTF